MDESLRGLKKKKNSLSGAQTWLCVLDRSSTKTKIPARSVGFFPHFLATVNLSGFGTPQDILLSRSIAVIRLCFLLAFQK